MRFLLVSVLDMVSGLHTAPMPVPNIGAAVRSFGDAVMNEKSEFYKHPEHYQLRGVGVWDDVAGQVGPWDGENAILANGADYKRVSMVEPMKVLPKKEVDTRQMEIK